MTMHSKIFQISSKPISKADYKVSEDYYEGHDSWADYIGDEVDDKEEREDCVGYLAHELRGVFTAVGRDHLVYLGEDALHSFLQEWADDIKARAAELTADNILADQRLFNIRATTNKTHRCSSYRVHIEEWNGYAGPFKDIIEWAANELKEGDSIYIGAIIDYHY